MPLLNTDMLPLRIPLPPPESSAWAGLPGYQRETACKVGDAEAFRAVHTTKGYDMKWHSGAVIWGL